MAEILVSDLCDCRPPLLIGGLFSFSPDSRAAPSPCLPASNRTVSTCPDYPAVPIALRIVFFHLFAIVLAPVEFLKPAQSLAL